MKSATGALSEAFGICPRLKLPGIILALSMPGRKLRGEFGSGRRSMKVSGTGNVGSTGGSRQARPAGGGGFRVAIPPAQGPAQVARTTGVSGISSVDALIALQDVGGPLERRRRAVGRASRILDVLDDVKVAMLDGELHEGELERLRRAVREERQSTEDPGLEDVLNEIETRAAVELAKLSRNRAA
jgi:hypothetical protein